MREAQHVDGVGTLFYSSTQNTTVNMDQEDRQ